MFANCHGGWSKSNARMRVYHGSIRAVQLGQPNLRDKGPAGKTNPVLPCVQIAAERVTVSPMRGGRTADDGFARSRSLLLPPVGHLGVGRGLFGSVAELGHRLWLCTSWRKWGAGSGRCSAMKQGRAGRDRPFKDRRRRLHDAQ